MQPAIFALIKPGVPGIVDEDSDRVFASINAFRVGRGFQGWLKYVDGPQRGERVTRSNRKDTADAPQDHGDAPLIWQLHRPLPY